MRYLYLHGFASGPKSRKAQSFLSVLPNLEIPLIDEGDFEHLTITAQLRVIERTLKGEPAMLLGSSMGGYLAALYAATHPEVDRLVLLAPAFSFSDRWANLAHWRETGWREAFHYADAKTRRVHYGLYEDSLKHPPSPNFSQPARIFHGVNDTVVPVEFSRAFAATHPNATLTELDSDHELLNVLPEITAAATAFLWGKL